LRIYIFGAVIKINIINLIPWSLKMQKNDTPEEMLKKLAYTFDWKGDRDRNTRVKTAIFCFTSKEQALKFCSACLELSVLKHVNNDNTFLIEIRSPEDRHLIRNFMGRLQMPLSAIVFIEYQGWGHRKSRSLFRRCFNEDKLKAEEILKGKSLFYTNPSLKLWVGHPLCKEKDSINDISLSDFTEKLFQGADLSDIDLTQLFQKIKQQSQAEQPKAIRNGNCKIKKNRKRKGSKISGGKPFQEDCIDINKSVEQTLKEDGYIESNIEMCDEQQTISKVDVTETKERCHLLPVFHSLQKFRTIADEDWSTPVPLRCLLSYVNTDNCCYQEVESTGFNIPALGPFNQTFLEWYNQVAPNQLYIQDPDKRKVVCNMTLQELKTRELITSP
jgi:hypothetical protein